MIFPTPRFCFFLRFSNSRTNFLINGEMRKIGDFQGCRSHVNNSGKTRFMASYIKTITVFNCFCPIFCHGSLKSRQQDEEWRTRNWGDNECFSVSQIDLFISNDSRVWIRNQRGEDDIILYPSVSICLSAASTYTAQLSTRSIRTT